MTLGRTSSGAIKIKTDSPKGLRAVECACCDPCSQFSNLCVNGLPLFSFPTAGYASCEWRTESTQCEDDLFKCYTLYYYETSPAFCTGPEWFIFFFADMGGGMAYPAGASKCGDDPYGTYTLQPGSPGSPPTISSCS